MKHHLTRLIRYIGKRMVEIGWGLADYGYPKVIQDSGWGETRNTLDIGVQYWDGDRAWDVPSHLLEDNSPMVDG